MAISLATFEKAADGLLSHLPERSRDVLTRRFGIGKTDIQTLQTIGDDYGVTRERVRQVESHALNVLSKHQGEIDLSVSALKQLFEEYGGLLGKTHLTEIVAGKDEQAVASVSFLLTVSDQFEELRENSVFESRWVLDRDIDKRAQRVVGALVAMLKEAQSPVSWDDLEKAAGEHLLPRALSAVIAACKTIERNVFGQYGLAFWPEISPRGVKDRAYLVLARHGSPLHFTEIADHINAAGFGGRRAHVQTVHNELIKDDRFILVGRGLYAAREWGYETGTVKDVIARVLDQSDSPLTRDQIVEAVLAQRHVQRNTILLNLHNNRDFSRLDDGRYALRGSVEEA